MKKYYVVPAELIDTNFPDDLEHVLSYCKTIFMEEELEKNPILESMKHYLSNDNEDHELILEQLSTQLNTHPDGRLDRVEYFDGEGWQYIQLWGKINDNITVREFCDCIGL